VEKSREKLINQNRVKQSMTKQLDKTNFERKSLELQFKVVYKTSKLFTT
jgi:hypothetical protein